MQDAESGLVKIAILDLYNGAANQGMRCIREILREYAQHYELSFRIDEFDVRQHNQLPDLSYDVYISSGGPGSPLPDDSQVWEEGYFNWIRSLEAYNVRASTDIKKQVFFICHSFQLACRHFNIGNICARRSTAFGIFPVHLLEGSNQETVFDGMQDPFYAVDSRDFQVIEPDYDLIRQQGAAVLALEKERPHVLLERAIMAVRFNDAMIGTQFHPEADAIGMSMHLQTEEKKQTVIANYGYDKWESMITQLNDPDKIMHTYAHILPNFLRAAIGKLQLAAA